MSSAESTPPQPPPERKRRRPALACEQCRSRKVRCDRNLPCTTCKKSRNQLCTYAPQPTPKRPAARKLTSSTSTSSPGYARHEPALLPLPPEPTHSHATPAAAPGSDAFGDVFSVFPRQNPLSSNDATALTPESLHGSGSGSGTGTGTGTAISHLVDRVKQLEHQLSTALAQQRRGDPPECAALCRDEPRPAEHLDRGFVSKTRYFGRTHWMTTARLVFFSCNFFGMVREKGSDINVRMERCKALARTIKSRRVPYLGDTAIGRRVPAREIADDLVDAYLRTSESVLRVVHVPSFRAEYERYWAAPSQAREDFVVLMQLCMAIGATVRDETFSLRAEATQWVYEAQLWLMMPCEKSRLTVAGLQVSLLLHQAKHMTNIGADLTWIGAGSLLRMAMSMGLHEDPRCIARMTAFRAEMRRRLWASVLEIQLQSSLDSGGPPLISPDDFDTEPPANLDDAQLVDGAETAYPIARDPAVATDMSVPLALHATWRARLAVVRAVNEVRSTATYDETLRVNSDLTTALQNMMRRLRALGPAVSAFQLRHAEFSGYRFLLGLHQPVISRALRNPVYYFSRKVCVDVSFRLAGVAFLQSPPTCPSEVDLQRLFTCASGEYRTALVQAAMLLGLELLHTAADEGGGRGRRAELRDVLEAWAGLCLRRVEAGETNVKGYMGSCALLAHVDAVEAGCGGEELEARVYAASRASLDRGAAILEAMAGEGPARSEDVQQQAAVPELDLELDDMEMLDDMMGDWSWSGFEGMTPGQMTDPIWGFQNPFPEPPAA